MAKKRILHPFDPPKHWVADADTETSHRYPDVYQVSQPGAVTGHELVNPHTIEVVTQSEIRMRIQLWTAGIWQIRYTKEQFSDQPSYALHPDQAPNGASFSVEEDKKLLVLMSEDVLCVIEKKNCQITFYDVHTGEVILAEAEPYLERSTILNGADHLRVSFTSDSDEAYYGLGDKSWDLDLRGRHFQNWNSDAFGYYREKDPLYRAIPFYYGLKKDLAYGIFLHNTCRSHFDFGSAKDDTVRMWTEGGEMDYFFIHGPTLNKVAQSYHSLTGVPELPPLWTQFRYPRQ